MSGLEQAIRSALARAESGNPETRARIYQSARNALEAGLRKQEINDPEAIAAQRHRLETTIRQIEAEQRAALKAARQEPVPGGSVAGSPESAPRPQPTGSVGSPAPEIPRKVNEAPAGPTADREPTLDEIRPERGDGFGPAAAGPRPATRQPAPEAESIVAASPRVAKAPRRRGRLFSFLLVVATLVAVLGTAVWWVRSSGLLLPPSARDGSVANPPQSVSGEDFPAGPTGGEALDTHNSFSADWREVFDPADTGALSAAAGGRFEQVSTDEGPAVRLVSTSADREGAVAVAVAPEVLQAMAGKTSTIALTVEPDSGKPVQVSVECDFGTLGNCGRHRFAVADRTDLLFQVTFEGSLSPSAAGRLLINSDVTGAGAGVNLFAVRILPGE
ncbi:biotin transporter BioY [Rhizobium sp. TRM96647]|uniref:biotin transporter BioY n=1 Tax=unclassified Rhizobium TaxID=2613769 RepID=UPI0021E8BFCD|nr:MULTISPECIES: biotin transporter BioY [unclassified Rhizobium]MCV3736627.1 biotin transporter BioY [Rhizobium sp. TRM96647]MCV3758996.1 biotin transporter BioY [Rhizobium sp. TRM96650]